MVWHQCHRVSAENPPRDWETIIDFVDLWVKFSAESDLYSEFRTRSTQEIVHVLTVVIHDPRLPKNIHLLMFTFIYDTACLETLCDYSSVDCIANTFLFYVFSCLSHHWLSGFELHLDHLRMQAFWLTILEWWGWLSATNELSSSTHVTCSVQSWNLLIKSHDC